MESSKVFNITLSFTRRTAVLLLSLFFLCWHPGFIGSETLTLTTYYPAPYGGYVSILTTGRTLLARDTGTVGIGTNNPLNTVKLDINGNTRSTGQIQWGNSRGTLTTDQGGSMELGGTGTPYIDFSQNSWQDFSARIMLSQAGRLRVESDLEITRDLYVNGSIRGVCRRIPYSVGSTAFCPANHSVIGFQGDGVARVTGFLPRTWAAQQSQQGAGTVVILGEDWGGTMVCCRFN
ncbi:MAG: hypothetical protein CVU79_12195 [Elusimicrobia bacterium HGW-Elusimicrobia-3]|nr:MAG: hypothetical protein CVU79_12195 [Elusimicrobia bacterium HGW-Elusimicrobia-3]